MIPSKPLILHADPEHTGIRSVIVPILLVCLIGGYWLSDKVVDEFISTESNLVLNCLGALVLGLALAAGAESLLKRLWKSGRMVVIDVDGLTVHRKGREPVAFNTKAPLYTLKWYFSLSGYPRTGRERRVPSKWLCYACQLMQDDRRVIFYSFLSKKEAEHTTDYVNFYRLEPKDVYDTSLRKRMTRPVHRPVLTSRILARKDGRYWSSEQRRWSEGLELSAADFVALLRAMDDRGVKQHGRETS